MTTAESKSINLNETERPPAEGTAMPARPHASQPNPLMRFIDWFWRGRAMKEARASSATAAPRAQELHRRARLAAELGTRALEPAGPLVNGTGAAVACDLYRQSIYWSLRALQPDAASANMASGAAVDPYAVWNAADPQVVAGALGAPASVELAKQAMIELSFVGLAELPASEQTRLARQLEHVATDLLESIETVQRVIDRLFWQRATRTGALVIVAVAALFGQSIMNERYEIQHDLAVGKPWKASSVFQPACTSPSQSCAESPHFFFVTQEDAVPTLEFDLLKPERISAVRVINRTDGYQDRAVPLAIEVSDDAKKWKEVARRVETFSVWKAEFTPVRARYVRFRALRKTWLHFNQVRILP